MQDHTYSSSLSPDQAKTKFTFLKPLLYFVLTAIAIMVAVFIYNNMERQSQHNLEADQKKLIRENIRSYVSAGNSEYTYSKLGGIYGLKIIVANSTDYLLENVRVKVSHIKSNGGLWKQQYIDFALVNPRSKLELPVPDEKRGVRVEYEISSIKSTSLSLY